MYTNFFKRLIDFTVALTGLLILSPLFLVTILMLLIGNNGKIFFIQKRPGKNDRIFSIYKFKTMNDRCDANGDLLPDNERITPVGRFLRKTSLDELPQLINVLLGDMSLVGPRPLLVDYLPLYSATQRRRHSVRPGITGWAQANGRNAITWQQKFDYDVWYVDNISFLLDMKIICLSAMKVFRQEGINAGQDTTMGRFEGN